MNRLSRYFLTASVIALASPLRAQEAENLGTILLDMEETIVDWITGITSGKEGDTGLTVLDGKSLAAGTGGSNDANNALKGLPNVQYANDLSTDAGDTIDNLVDLRPSEVSISGARVTENNFMIDGSGINSLFGNENPLQNDLSRQTGTTAIYGIYGLHSQSQFVPASIIDEIEVIDSNASARFGGFQGGVVNYKLKPAKTSKAEGSFSMRYSGDSLSSYKLGTRDGKNPGNVAKPSVDALKLSFDHNQPLGDRTALRFRVSTETASGDKQKDAQYLDRSAETKTVSNFWSAELLHEMEASSRLRFKATHTDYDQKFVANWSRDYELHVINRGVKLEAAYEKEWEGLSFAGIEMSDVKLVLKAETNNNNVTNDSNTNVQTSWRGWGATYNRVTGERLTLFETDEFDDFCDGSLGAAAWFAGMSQNNVTCQTGGFGDRGYSDQRQRVLAELTGDVWNGGFVLGAAYERLNANRWAEQTIMNSSTTVRPATAAFPAYTCLPGATDCLDDQFIGVRILAPAYNIDIEAERAEFYFELDQTFGKLNLRGGLRADYNDVLKNVDVAPRFAATWTANDSLRFTIGANRYYSEKFMTYAINDAVPRGWTQIRSAVNGVVPDWTTGNPLTSYRYLQGDLDTPYNDEFSFSTEARDPWTDGNWRVKYIRRLGRDQFARQPGGSTVTGNQMTNDGSSEYDGISLEYAKRFRTAPGSRLDYVGLRVSGGWSRSTVSNNSVFVTADESYYFYNGKSYSAGEFDAARGNMDIPVTARVEVSGSWDGGRYGLALASHTRFAYDAAVDTGTNVTETNADGYTGPHDLYADQRMKAVTTLNLSGRARLAEIEGNALELEFEISNLLNETGNAYANATRPWMRGRSIWIGTTYTW